MVVRPVVRYAFIGMLALAATAALADPPASFAICGACHSEKPGALGPSLHGVIGRKAGSAAGFRYSPAMKANTTTWSKQSLDAFLTNPQASVPGNAMAFPGVADAKQRAEIIGYIETLK